MFRFAKARLIRTIASRSFVQVKQWANNAMVFGNSLPVASGKGSSMIPANRLPETFRKLMRELGMVDV